MNDPIGQATYNLISAANELTRLLASAPRCPRCHGRRMVRADPHPDVPAGGLHLVPCPVCGGEGRLVLDFPSGTLPRSHSDSDLELRQSPRTRCPSCGGQTGTYDGQGQWWPCAVCDATGYQEGVVR